MAPGLALPGEFTYRAFRNGKMDLLQAEAVNDLIQANSRVYALMEFDNLEGRLSKRVGSIRARLVQMAIAVETEIEFAEEQQLKTDCRRFRVDGGDLTWKKS